VRLTWALGFVFAGACATMPKVAPSPQFTLALPPAALGMELCLAQRITVRRGDQHRTLEAQLEVDAASVRLAAVALGQRVATLRWDGATLEQQVSTHVPSVVTAERILTDVQLAWWPADAVRAGLKNRFTLEEGPGRRVVWLDGAPFATVDYEGTPPAYRHVRLTHERSGYTLDIESVEAR
jgi:Protein of unknown function (DUF3261)